MKPKDQFVVQTPMGEQIFVYDGRMEDVHIFRSIVNNKVVTTLQFNDNELSEMMNKWKFVQITENDKRYIRGIENDVFSNFVGAMNEIDSNMSLEDVMKEIMKKMK